MTREKYNASLTQQLTDLEACNRTPTSHSHNSQTDTTGPTSAFQQLAILDRFLALWIFLAMAVGIILGNFVPNTSKVLERGEFVGVSVPIAIVTRLTLKPLNGMERYDQKFLKWIGPLSLIGLLFTILVLFASQGREVVHWIVSVIRVAAPLIVYCSVVFLATLPVTHRSGFGYKLSCTQSFTTASNNFELAIAIAIATFGVHSDQALATTVGPLVEVPVFLGLVYVIKWFAKR